MFEAGSGCSTNSIPIDASHWIFAIASSGDAHPSFASTRIGFVVTARIASTFSLSLGRPTFTFSDGYFAPSRTFCCITSAVSMPIVNVVTAILEAGMPSSR